MRNKKGQVTIVDPDPFLCRFNFHCRLRSLVRRFNGGRGAWTCPGCNLILAYGNDRPTKRKELLK
jgi:ribosomal protein L37AE/L43A